MGMNVFIDTNILLKFFHFTKDQLDALSDVFASHEHGKAQVHLTQQVCDEFKRNREAKIKDALKKFRDAKIEMQLPSFMRGYQEFDRIQETITELQTLTKSLSDKVNKDVADSKLEADALIADIFERADILETTKKIYDQVQMRVTLGNPPGKQGSIGDAINWTILLAEVPEGEDVHIISEDGDYFSILNEKAVNPFLADEWTKKKNSRVHVYRSLSAFMTEHFDGVAFSFDKEKDTFIDDLLSVGSYAACHQVIAKLEKFSYFSQREVERILAAAGANSQFGGIMYDYDVSDFLNRVAVPKMGTIADPAYLEILEKVVEEKRNRI